MYCGVYVGESSIDGDAGGVGKNVFEAVDARTLGELTSVSL